jgi:hypothetical protein
VYLDIHQVRARAAPLHFTQPHRCAALGNRSQMGAQLKRAVRDLEILEGATYITIGQCQHRIGPMVHHGKTAVGADGDLRDGIREQHFAAEPRAIV